MSMSRYVSSSFVAIARRFAFLSAVNCLLAWIATDAIQEADINEHAVKPYHWPNDAWRLSRARLHKARSPFQHASSTRPTVGPAAYQSAGRRRTDRRARVASGRVAEDDVRLPTVACILSSVVVWSVGQSARSRDATVKYEVRESSAAGSYGPNWLQHWEIKTHSPKRRIGCVLHAYRRAMLVTMHLYIYMPVSSATSLALSLSLSLSRLPLTWRRRLWSSVVLLRLTWTDLVSLLMMQVA